MDRELTDVERMAIAQALYNRIGAIVSTKDPDNLRAAIDEFYADQFFNNGSKSFEVRIDGEKVGTYSIKQSKPKPQITTKAFEMADREKAVVYANTIPSEAWWRFIYLRLEEFLEWYFTETGEVPDGCEIVEHVTPEQPAQYAGGTLKVDADLVAEAVARMNLDTGIVGLLEG